MPCSKLRFLVVEDNDFQRGMLARLLMTLGASAVEQAADGTAGLAVLVDPARPVDIVVSDLAMPGMDGLEFMRRLGESGNRVSLAVPSAVDRPLLVSVVNTP
jgi:CheY-like chemotaxis protein